MAGKTILITGNMGYVGPCVVKRLRASHPAATLVGLDMGYFAHCLSNAEFLPERRVDLQRFADVRDVEDDVVEGVEAVVHLAAISNDAMGSSFEKVTYDVNWRASVALAKAAKRRGARAFVFASSCSMYGSADERPRTESSPLNPLTAYARSKVETEVELEKLADRDFQVTCLRFATACGMSERLRLDLVVNDFVAGAVASGKIGILSDGTPWRPLIHVSDMARGIDWALQRGPGDGGVFLAVNVGSNGWNYRVKELAEAVAEIVPNVAIEIDPGARPDPRSYRVDFSLFEKLAPGHQPQVDLRTAIRELAHGLGAMGFHDADFRSSQYMRLAVLRRLRSRGLLDENLAWSDASAPGPSGPGAGA